MSDRYTTRMKNLYWRSVSGDSVPCCHLILIHTSVITAHVIAFLPSAKLFLITMNCLLSYPWSKKVLAVQKWENNSCLSHLHWTWWRAVPSRCRNFSVFYALYETFCSLPRAKVPTFFTTATAPLFTCTNSYKWFLLFLDRVETCPLCCIFVFSLFRLMQLGIW